MRKRLTPGQIAYRLYLRSPGWRIRRGLALDRAGYVCEREGCDETRGLQVHHLTYARVGHELPADLMVLCRDHHREEHKLKRAKKERVKQRPKPKKVKRPAVVIGDRFAAARANRNGPPRDERIPSKAEREERKQRGRERALWGKR